MKLPGRGESGRGFAVVAGQIKKLAEQSDQSSQEIEQIASTLIRDSSLAVESMQSMQQIITSQSESMAETQNIVKEVLGEIGNSMQSIRQIKASTQRLEDSRNEVVQAVGELSGIAEENVESTKNLRWNTGSCRNVPAGICKCRAAAGDFR